MSRNPDHVRIERAKGGFSVVSVLGGVADIIGVARTLDKAFDLAYAWMDTRGRDYPIDRC